VAAAAVARSRGVPYVIQAHGSLDPWHREQKRRAKDLYHALLEDPIIRGAAAIVCTSRREEMAIRNLGYTAPMWVIPVGINVDELRLPGVADFGAANGIDAQARVVTFLGRISAKKGVPLLIESFRSTASAFPKARLVIAGPDDEGIGSHLMPAIANAGLAGRISFLGVVDGPEKRALLQRSDVFVLASADESFGIAVAEAMAVGCPVVVSPEVAMEDIVRASGAGIVAAREPVAIAAAIAAILADIPRAISMGGAGKRAVDEQFAWPIVARQMESMYEAIVTLTRRHANGQPAANEPRSTTQLAFRFACPRCRAALHISRAGSGCESCEWSGTTVADVAVLTQNLHETEHDELDHNHGHGHKSAQAAHYDRSDDEEFEVRRPHGTPRFYRYLLGQKLRRALEPIRPHLLGASVLTVCGGSGMEAEYFARAGAAVISSDLALGAATRAKVRSDRFNLGFRSIAADVEHLPFTDQSVDVVAVHDGLHHLDDPYAGLAEMARVARRWVVVTEPAQAAITNVAVRLGLALETEEAGNKVARMEPARVANFLEQRGFWVLRSARYAMYYRHRPGLLMRILSLPVIFPLARLVWRVTNTAIGRFGNKMVVVAERLEPATGRASSGVRVQRRGAKHGVLATKEQVE